MECDIDDVARNCGAEAAGLPTTRGINMISSLENGIFRANVHAIYPELFFSKKCLPFVAHSWSEVWRFTGELPWALN